jgi:hypothetical protein
MYVQVVQEQKKESPKPTNKLREVFFIKFLHIEQKL